MVVGRLMPLGGGLKMGMGFVILVVETTRRIKKNYSVGQKRNTPRMEIRNGQT
jgi:hypothetical protein